MRTEKLLWLMPLFVLSACGRGGDAPVSAADSTRTTAAAPALSPAHLADSIAGHKVIRTADLQCNVQNVFAATTQLERIVKAAGGIMQQSDMSNTTTETKTIFYKPDSLRQVQTYTTTAFLTLRVCRPLRQCCECHSRPY